MNKEEIVKNIIVSKQSQLKSLPESWYHKYKGYECEFSEQCGLIYSNSRLYDAILDHEGEKILIEIKRSQRDNWFDPLKFIDRDPNVVIVYILYYKGIKKSFIKDVYVLTSELITNKLLENFVKNFKESHFTTLYQDDYKSFIRDFVKLFENCIQIKKSFTLKLVKELSIYNIPISSC